MRLRCFCMPKLRAVLRSGRGMGGGSCIVSWEFRPAIDDAAFIGAMHISLCQEYDQARKTMSYAERQNPLVRFVQKDKCIERTVGRIDTRSSLEAPPYRLLSVCECSLLCSVLQAAMFLQGDGLPQRTVLSPQGFHAKTQRSKP